MIGRLRKFFRGSEGASMVLTALGLVAFLGFASLAIDMGRLYVVRNELQNVADAAALAGVSNLIKDQSGQAVRDATAAQAAVLAVAQRQYQLSTGLTPPTGRTDFTVTFGEWNIYAGNPETAWTDLGATCGVYSNANAVRVTIHRTSGMTFGPVTNLMAGVLGNQFNTSALSATATAYLGFAGAAETGTVTIPVAIPESLLTAAKKEDSQSWWASLMGPKEAVASSSRQVTFKDLGGSSFYQSNLGKPLFDVAKGYLVIVNTSDSVPGTVVDNIERNYQTSGVTPVRAMSRGTRLYPISEYQWASNIKTIFNAFKSAYNAKKNSSGKWRVMVPVYSTTNPTARQEPQGLLRKLAKWFSFGPSEAHACFTFWSQSYPGGNVPIYVEAFANVDVTNVTYNSNCDDCDPYNPAASNHVYYSSQVNCMVNNPNSCRNANSITIDIPLDTSTVSPSGTQSGGPDNQHTTPGGNPNQGAVATIPRLVK